MLQWCRASCVYFLKQLSMCFPFVPMSCDAGGGLKTQGANLSDYIKDIFDQALSVQHTDMDLWLCK